MSADSPAPVVLRDLLIATSNPGKISEIRGALDGLRFRILTPADLPHPLPEVEENGETLLANAQLKARAWAKAAKMLALADDSGLEVDALEGAPGVQSARWSGGGPEENNRKLLRELKALGDVPRSAVFRTVMVVAEPEGREDWVAGFCEGRITQQPQGDGGFGYDPLFSFQKPEKPLPRWILRKRTA